MEVFGQVNYLYVFLAFFLAVNDFGVNTILIREISRDPGRAPGLLGGILPFKLLLAVSSVFAAWGILFSLPHLGELGQALGIFALILPVIALETPIVIYHVLLKMDRASFWNVVNRLFASLFLLVAALANRPLRAVAAALVLAEVLYLALLIKDTRRFVRPAWRWNPALWKEILRSSIPLGIMGLLVSGVTRTAFILLERLPGHFQLGLYAAAYKITGLIEALPIMVLTTLYPLFCRYAHEDRKRLRALYRKCLAGLAGLALPVGIFVILFSQGLTSRIFGAEFAKAGEILPILIWSSIFLFPAIVPGYLLVALGKEHFSLTIMTVAWAVNLGLNLLWIPRWGAAGAASSQAVTFGLILGINLLVVEFVLRQSAQGEPPSETAAFQPLSESLGRL